jgi:nitrite reductase/ring-hydroxylating ferredoxin subunit
VKLFEASQLQPGASVRFPLRQMRGAYGPWTLEGFAIRLGTGALRAWVNLCPHRGQAVDLGDGQLYSRAESTRGLLECQAHGAYFDADSGLCITGACPGRSLTPVALEEHDGAIWLLPEPAPAASDEER